MFHFMFCIVSQHWMSFLYSKLFFKLSDLSKLKKKITFSNEIGEHFL